MKNLLIAIGIIIYTSIFFSCNYKKSTENSSNDNFKPADEVNIQISTSENNCTMCGGTGKMNCIDCFGKGEILCPQCKGESGVVYNEYSRYANNRVSCRNCSNTGYVKCPSCGGKKTETCTKCNGTGK